MNKSYRIIGKPLPKKDADMLLRGKGVYTSDLCPADALVVKILRSPHANAIVEEIKTDVKTIAEKPGKRWDAIVDKVIWAVCAAVIAFLLGRLGL